MDVEAPLARQCPIMNKHCCYPQGKQNSCEIAHGQIIWCLGYFLTLQYLLVLIVVRCISAQVEFKRAASKNRVLSLNKAECLVKFSQKIYNYLKKSCCQIFFIIYGWILLLSQFLGSNFLFLKMLSTECLYPPTISH